MDEINVEQIRSFRLHSHHLDKKYQRTDIVELVGAWETALYNRVPDCSVLEMEHLLYKEKSLLQRQKKRFHFLMFNFMWL